MDEKLSKAASIVKATYLHPYQMHGSMGTSCAVADVQGNKATVWSPTQSAYPTRSGVATMLGIPADNVRVVFVRGAGCYGINGADTVSYDAALLSQAVGKPVRVQLSRQDEMAWENYGFPYVIDQRVGIDADGTIVAWDYEAWFASLGGRPGTSTPGNVITGMLAGFSPAPFAPRAAAEPGGRFNNGSNAAPSYVVGRVGGSAGGAGVVTSERVLTHTVASPFFTGPLRSPSRLQNTFAHECLLDEVAAHVRADPVGVPTSACERSSGSSPPSAKQPSCGAGSPVLLQNPARHEPESHPAGAWRASSTKGTTVTLPSLLKST